MIRRSPIRRMAGKAGMRARVKTLVNGKWLSSQLEARTYGDLLLMERAGDIRNLRTQVRHDLYTGAGDSCCTCQRPKGSPMPSGLHKIRGVILDFMYEEFRNGKWVDRAADAKGWMEKDSGQAVAYRLYDAIHEFPIILFKGR